MMMPWTRLRLHREAIQRAFQSQRREIILASLTGWDLDSLNDALAAGNVQIMPAGQALTIIIDTVNATGARPSEITDMFHSISKIRWRTDD